MKNVTKLTVSAIALCGGAMTAAPALAQGAPSVSGNVAITTDYRFRGLTFSGEQPAIQGGIDLGWESGFYVGTWASSIESFSGSNDEIELDLYAGYSGDLGSSGLGFDVGVLGYFYPGADAPGDQWVAEAYASIGGSAGAASWTLGGAYIPDQDNTAGDNVYLFADADMGFGDSPFYGFVHGGYEDGVWGSDKFDWSVGVGVAGGGVDFSVAYVGYDQTGGDDDTLLATLSSSW